MSLETAVVSNSISKRLARNPPISTPKRTNILLERAGRAPDDLPPPVISQGNHGPGRWEQPWSSSLAGASARFPGSAR
jgi:hypothetical protein